MPNGRTGRFFTDIWRSASDMRFYGEAAARPFGAALRHLAKVALLLGAVLAAVIVVGLMSFNHAVAWCMDNLPVITVKNGEASADVPQPKVIEFTTGSKEKFAVVIDTTGATPGIGPAYANGVLVKRRGLTVKGGGRVFSIAFDSRASVTADRAYFKRLLVRPAWIALAAAGIFPVTLAALFLQSAAAAVLALLVSRLRGAARGFRPTLQMSFYAAALAVCFLLAVLLAGVRLHPVFLLALYAFVHAAFLIGAVLSAGGGGHGA